MWLGTVLGRFWCWLFAGAAAGACLDDPRVQVWLVRRLLPRWAAGQAWGNVILVRTDCWDRPGTLRLLEHEYRHVVQWRRWGVAFVPAYILASCWAGARYGLRNAYRMNHFERDARGEL